MNTKLYFAIALRIVFLFTLTIFATFIPEYFRDFFGDTVHVCQKQYCSHGTVDMKHDWGVRHYWFFVMLFFLFLLSLIDTVAHIIRKVEYYYPEIFEL